MFVYLGSCVYFGGVSGGVMAVGVIRLDLGGLEVQARFWKSENERRVNT